MAFAHSKNSAGNRHDLIAHLGSVAERTGAFPNSIATMIDGGQHG